MIRQGFSLIELLVVVAIIGILASVGLVAYQVFIDSTKDEITLDTSNFLARTLNQDIVSIENKLSARSEIAANLTLNSACHTMVKDLVETINGSSSDNGRSSPFNENEGSLCNGIEAASNARTNAVDNFTLPRGKTVVYCDGLDPDAHIVDLDVNINVRTCTCTESDCSVAKVDSVVGKGGTTGYRCVVQLNQPYTSGGTINFDLQDNFSATGCLTNHTELTISGNKGKATVTSCTDTQCTGYTGPALDNNTLLYTEEEGRCYYPFGEMLSISLDNRHTCRNE